MTHISVDELQSVLDKSGLPLGGNVLPQVARDKISNTVYSQDTRMAGIKQKHKHALDAIAAMDQKLSGVYGDPTSPLFIANPLKRESLKTGALNTGYKAAGDIQGEAVNTQRDLENQIDDALSAYQSLTKEQIKQEKQTVKTTTNNTKTANVPTGQIKLTKNQKLAGFADAASANYWQQIKEADFKRAWVQNMLEGGGVPQKGFTIKDIKDNYDSWKKTQPKKKTKGSTGTTTTKRDTLF